MYTFSRWTHSNSKSYFRQFEKSQCCAFVFLHLFHCAWCWTMNKYIVSPWLSHLLSGPPMQCLHDTSVRYACNDWWRPEHGLFYFSSDRIARYIRASGSYCTIALLRDVSGALSVTHTARCIQPACTHCSVHIRLPDIYRWAKNYHRWANNHFFHDAELEAFLTARWRDGEGCP